MATLSKTRGSFCSCLHAASQQLWGLTREP